MEEKTVKVRAIKRCCGKAKGDEWMVCERAAKNLVERGKCELADKPKAEPKAEEPKAKAKAKKDDKAE